MKQQTLTDTLNRPLHDLRISLIDRCNFRCTYCMPEEKHNASYSYLKQSQWMSFDEIERLTKIFVSLGVDKIRLTGGEPLLRPNIEQLIHRLHLIDGIKDLALTTNAALLKDKAESLKKAGLDRLTISLDSINLDTFKRMSGKKGELKEILNGIKRAEQAGFTSMKINTVIQKGVNDAHILELVEYFRSTKHIVRFIEYMDVGNCNHWQKEHVVPSKDILKQIDTQYPLEAQGPNYYGEVADRYRFKDGKGEIGFISSITQPFCTSCTRARLTTDGQFVTCLFAKGGINLRNMLREGASNEEITAKITQIWSKRADRYSEERSETLKNTPQNPKIEMFQIGG